MLPLARQAVRRLRTTAIWRLQPRCEVLGALLALPANLNLASLGLSWPRPDPGQGDAGLRCLHQQRQRPPARSSASTPKRAPSRRSHSSRAPGASPSAPTASAALRWTNDVMTIIKNLDVVNNNSPTSIGGGGTPIVSWSADRWHRPDTDAHHRPRRPPRRVRRRGRTPKNQPVRRHPHPGPHPHPHPRRPHRRERPTSWL